MCPDNFSTEFASFPQGHASENIPPPDPDGGLAFEVHLPPRAQLLLVFSNDCLFFPLKKWWEIGKPPAVSSRRSFFFIDLRGCLFYDYPG